MTTTKHSFNYKGVQYPVEISKKMHAKRYIIKIKQNIILLTIPRAGTIKYGLYLLEEKKDWLYENIKKRSTLPSAPLVKSHDLIHNTVSNYNFFYDGYFHQLKIIAVPDSYPSSYELFFHLDKREILLHIQINILEKHQLQAHFILKKHFHALLAMRVKQYVQKWEEVLGVQHRDIKIKSLKSLWGCCSIEKKLTFNLALIMVPANVLEYVVIHELCHFIHHDHSKRFWDLVKSLDNEYQLHSRWLKKHYWLTEYSQNFFQK